MISKFYCDKKPFQILPNIFLLGDNYFFNLYLVCGKDKTALVELGVSLIVDEIINQIKEVGVEPDFLILTHPHSDHITGWNKLHQTYPNARLIAGDKVCEMANSSKSSKIMYYEDKYLYDQFVKMDYFFKGRPINKLIDFKNPIIINNDFRIDLGGISINCIPVGGHSVGNIIIEVPERKALFVSDSLGYQINNKHIPMFLSDLNDYLQTIEKIIDLRVNFIGPAHYGPFLGYKAMDIVKFVKKETISFCKEINEIHNISVETVFDYMNDGLLSQLSRKSMTYCAQLLINNIKKMK